MPKISTYSGGSSDWLEDFIASQAKTEAVRKVQADYLSQLRSHVEQQQSAGRYTTVESAIEDFSNRLGLSTIERQVLAATVKQANFFDKSQQAKDLANGAPKSILPGVKPSKQTNKVKINEEIAQSPDTNTNVSMGPAGQSSKANLEKNTIHAADEKVFSHTIEGNTFKLHTPELGDVVFTRADTGVVIAFGNKTSQPFDREKVLAFIKSKLDALANFKTSPSRVALAKWLDQTETTPEAEEPEAQKAPEVTPESPKAVESPAPIPESPINKVPTDSIEEQQEEEEEEIDPALEEALKQVSPVDIEREPKAKKPVDIKKMKIGLSGKTNIQLLPGIATADTALAGIVSRDQYRRIGVLFNDTANIASEYERLDKTASDLMSKIDSTMNEKKLFGSIFSTINAAKQIAAIDSQIAAVQRLLQTLDKDSPEYADKQNQLTQLENKKDRNEKQISRGLNVVAAEFGFAPTIDNLLKQLNEQGLEAEVQKRYSGIVKQHSTLDERHKQVAVARQAAEYQLEGAKVSRFMLTKRKQLLVPSEQFYKAIDTKVAAAREKLLPRNAAGMPISEDRLTPEQRAEWLQLLKDKGLSSEDVASYKHILSTAPGPSRLDAAGLNAAYKEALASEKPIVTRAVNQKKENGIEYVYAPNSNKKYQGYLPLDEIAKYQSVVDTGLSENELLKTHGKQAVDIFLDRRFDAIAKAESTNLAKVRELRALSKKVNDASTTDDKQTAYQELLQVQQEIHDSLPVELRVYFYRPLVEASAVRVPSRLLMPIIYQDILKIKSDPAVKHAEYLADLQKAMKAKGFASESYDVTLAEYFDQVVDAEHTAYVNKINRVISTTTHNVDKLTAAKIALQDKVEQLEGLSQTNEVRMEKARLNKLIANKDLSISKNSRDNTKALLLQKASEIVNLDIPSVVAGSAAAFKITPEVLRDQIVDAAAIKGLRFDGIAGINLVIRDVLETVFDKSEEKLGLIVEAFPTKAPSKKDKDESSSALLNRLRQVGIEGVISGLPYPVLVVPPESVPQQIIAIKPGEQYTPIEKVSFPSKCSVGKLVLEGRDFIVWSGSLDEVADQIAALFEKGVNCDFDAQEAALESVVTSAEYNVASSHDLDFTLDEVGLSAEQFRQIFTTAFNKAVRSQLYTSEAKTRIPKSRSKIRRVPGLIGDPDTARIGQKKEIYESARQAALEAAKQYGQEVKKDEVAAALLKQKKELSKLEKLRNIARQYYAGARSYTIEKDFKALFKEKELSPTMKAIASLIQEMSDPNKAKVPKYTSVEDPTQKIDAGMHLLYILRKMIGQKDRAISALSNFGFNKQEIELVCFRGHGPYSHKVEYSFVSPQTITQEDVDDQGQEFAANIFDSDELKELATYGLQTYIANQTEGFYKVAGRRPRCPDCQHIFDTYTVHNALRGVVEGTASGRRKDRSSSYLSKLSEQDAQTSYATLNDWLDKLDAPTIGQHSRSQVGLDSPISKEQLPLLPLAEVGDPICYAKYMGVFSEGQAAEEEDASQAEDAIAQQKARATQRLNDPSLTPKGVVLRKWQVELRGVLSKWLYDLARDFNFPNRNAYINHNAVAKQRIIRKPLGTQIREGVELVGYTANGSSIVFDSTEEGQIKAWQKVSVRSKDGEGKRINVTRSEFESRKKTIEHLASSLQTNAVDQLTGIFTKYLPEQLVSLVFPFDTSYVAAFKGDFSKAIERIAEAVKSGKPLPRESIQSATKAMADYYGDLTKISQIKSERDLASDNTEHLFENQVIPMTNEIVDDALAAIEVNARNSGFSTNPNRQPIVDIERIRKIENTMRSSLEHYHAVQQKQMVDNWKWLEGSCARFLADFESPSAEKEKDDKEAPKSRTEQREERRAKLSENIRAVQRVRMSTVSTSGEDASEIQQVFDQFYKTLLGSVASRLPSDDVLQMSRVRMKLLEQLIRPPVRLGFGNVEGDIKEAIENASDQSPEAQEAIQTNVLTEHKRKVAARVLKYVGDILDSENLPPSVRRLMKQDQSVAKLFSNARLAITKTYLDYFIDVYNLASLVGAQFSKDKPKKVDPSIFYKVKQIRPTQFSEKYTRIIDKREVPNNEFAKDLATRAQSLADKAPTPQQSGPTSNDHFKVEGPADIKARPAFVNSIKDLVTELEKSHLDSEVINALRNKIVANSNSVVATNLFIKDLDQLITALQKGAKGVERKITDSDAYQDLIDLENELIEAFRNNDQAAVAELSSRYRSYLVGNRNTLGGFIGKVVNRLFKAAGGSIAFVLEPTVQAGDRIYIDSAKDGIRKPLRATQDQLEKRTMLLTQDIALNEFETCDPQVLFTMFSKYMQLADEPRDVSKKTSSRDSRKAKLALTRQALPLLVD